MFGSLKFDNDAFWGYTGTFVENASKSKEGQKALKKGLRKTRMATFGKNTIIGVFPKGDEDILYLTLKTPAVSVEQPVMHLHVNNTYSNVKGMSLLEGAQLCGNDIKATFSALISKYKEAVKQAKANCQQQNFVKNISKKMR